MLTPWQNPRADPSGVKVNELTLTVRLELSLHDRFAEKVRCNFEWLRADGSVSDPIDTGPASTWEKDSIGGDSAMAAHPLGLLMHARFSKVSPLLQGTCNFIRQLARQAVCVHLHYPGLERPEQSPDVSHTADVSLHLAPLLFSRPGSPSGLVEEVREFANGALRLRCVINGSDALMSDAIAAHLNPMLITVQDVRKLPDERHLGQTRDLVYVATEMFGQRMSSSVSELDTKGDFHPMFHSVVFVGTWQQDALREHLLTEQLAVEVHDRDQVFAEGCAPRRSSVDEATGDQASKARASKSNPHGVARFSLAELLRLSSPHPSLALQGALESKLGKRQRGRPGMMNAGLKVSQLFGDCACDVLDSLAVSFQKSPGYMDAQSYVTVTVCLARPLLTAREHNEDEPGTGLRAQETVRLELFGRMVIVSDLSRVSLQRQLLRFITENNGAVLDFRLGGSRVLGVVELTEEEKRDTTLDIITGFVIMDHSTRITVIEGLRDGAMERIAKLIASNSKRGTRVLHHCGIGFSRRLYGDFNVALKQIKLRIPSMEALLCEPDLFFKREEGADNLTAGLQALVAIKRAERLQHLKAGDTFPSAKSLIEIEEQYGLFMTNEELEGEIGFTRPSQSLRGRKTAQAGPDSSHGVSAKDQVQRQAVESRTQKRLTLGPRWQFV